jgi:glycosyltransferase involved in cell wall biosynthesis
MNTLVSFAIPAYQAASTLRKTLASIFSADAARYGFDVEAVVVNDGSPDAEGIVAIVRGFPKARLLHHEQNRGVWAARATAMAQTRGDIAMFFDADDWLVDEWPKNLREIVERWPLAYELCRSLCVTSNGVVTSNAPIKDGPFSLEDWIKERVQGEFLTLYRGDFARDIYKTLPEGDHEIEHFLIYHNVLSKSDAWLTGIILRVYNYPRPGSLVSEVRTPRQARRLAQYNIDLLGKFGEEFRSKAPRTYGNRLVRGAVYLRLSKGDGYWPLWWKAIGYTSPLALAGAAVGLTLGPRILSLILRGAKKLKLIKEFG